MHYLVEHKLRDLLLENVLLQTQLPQFHQLPQNQGLNLFLGATGIIPHENKYL